MSITWYDDILISYNMWDAEAEGPHVQTQSELLRETLTQTNNKVYCSKMKYQDTLKIQTLAFFLGYLMATCFFNRSINNCRLININFSNNYYNFSLENLNRLAECFSSFHLAQLWLLVMCKSRQCLLWNSLTYTWEW